MLQSTAKPDGPCKNCLQMLDLSEQRVIEIEDLKRQISMLKRELELNNNNGILLNSNNVSLRKDSHGSISTQNERRPNPLED